jgi:hypothetical protein
MGESVEDHQTEATSTRITTDPDGSTRMALIQDCIRENPLESVWIRVAGWHGVDLCGLCDFVVKD